jgi:pimeloyl-ACP methyl ester carboxylesterase
MVVALLIAAVLVCVLLIATALAVFTAYTARRVVRVLPPMGDFVNVDGARIHYVEAGQGPTLLLVHGLGSQSGNFTHSLVGRLTSEYHVVAIDRPGAGYSTRPRGTSAGIRAQSQTIAAVIEVLGLERPVVVGHSLGGAIALALALDHPELVAALALVAPLTQVEEVPPPAFRALAIESPTRRWLMTRTVAIPAAILRSGAVLKAVFAPDPVPRDYATAGGGLLGLRPSSVYATSSDLVAVREDMPRLVARYGSLQLPVGILFGRGDRILDYRRHGELTAGQIPDARLELIEGGHMLPLTAPDRVAAFVRDVSRHIRTGATKSGGGTG